MTTVLPSTNSSSYESKVQVSCWSAYDGRSKKNEGLCNSLLFVSFRVEVNYKPQTTSTLKSMPKKIRSHESSSSSRVVFDQLVSEDRKGVVSTMLSDIPFALENIEWRRLIHEPWTALQGKDELAARILDVIRNMMVKEGTKDQNNKESKSYKEYGMSINIEKSIMLPNNEYESMVQAEKDKQERKNIIDAVAFEVLAWYHAVAGRVITRSETRRRLAFKVRENGKKITASELDSMMEDVEREMKNLEKQSKQLAVEVTKLINRLDDIRVTGSNLSWMGSCAICLQDIPIGDPVKRLPCLHGFHRGCIHWWLGSSRSCPLCRRLVS